MMTGAGRELAIAERTQDPAQRTETRNSSQTHIAKSFSRQRTTPWIAGIGPLSTIAARASRWAVFSLPGWPGASVVR